MKRLRLRAAAVLSAVVALGMSVSGGGANAESFLVPEPIIELRAAAGAAEGQLHVNPNFEILPAYSFAQATNDSSHALHGALYPGFLIDAFFYLYGAQSVERTVLGIAETVWPQGPEERDATISDPLLRNFGDPATFPARLGRASAFSKQLRAGGDTLLAGLSLPNVSVGQISSSTRLDGFGKDATGSGRAAVADARQTAGDIRIAGGAVRIEKVHGSARVVSGADVGRSEATADLLIAGATVGGTPVRITQSGVQGPTTQATAAANQLLSALGIELRTLDGGRSVDASSGRIDATASSGGLLVAFDRTFSPPDAVRNYNDQFCAALGQVDGASGTCVHPERDTRIALILGSADVRATFRPKTIDLGLRRDSLGGLAPETITETITIPAPRVLGAQIERRTQSAPPSSEDLAAAPASRRVTTILGFPATLADAVKAAYLALILVAALVTAGRRILRATSAP